MFFITKFIIYYSLLNIYLTLKILPPMYGNMRLLYTLSLSTLTTKKPIPVLEDFNILLYVSHKTSHFT